MALLFSRDLLKPLEGTMLKDSLDSALSKAESALPGAADEYRQNLRDHFAVGLGPHKRYREHRETLEHLARAITRNRTVEMRYYTAGRDSTNRRKVDPYRLWYAAGSLYLIGYCHVRRDVRMFAVDRIRSLTITNHPCQLPLNFDLEAYVQDALVVMRGEQIEVELLFDRKTTAWARDRIWHPSQVVVIGKDGCLNLVLHVADTPELAGWILSFGPGVRVIRPETHREKILSAAAVETYAAAFHLPQERNEVWYFLNNNLGYCLNKIGRHAEAEKYCREAIGMQPRYHNAYKNLGIALEGLGRYADAASSYIYAARACPEDPRALAHLQNLLAAHGEVLDEVPDILAQLHECHEAAQSRRGKPRLQ
jgi:predicted DNA-binding transcriptional regulator YafY